jgi:hypothetical protein
MAATNSYTKSTPHAVTGVKRQWQTSGSPNIGQPTSVINGIFQWTDYLNGEKRPGWKQAIREGRDATTNMTAETRSITHLDGDQYVMLRRKSDGQIFHRRDSGWCDTSGEFPTQTFAVLDSVPAHRDASSKWYSRATAAQTQLMLGVTVGELGKTLSMVGGRGKKMLALLYLWRTAARRLRKERDWRRKLANLYLEYAYGWKPLALEIAGALSAYRDPRLEITRVSAMGERTSNSVYETTTTFGAFRYNRTHTSTSDVKVRIRGAVKVATAGHGRNMQAFGLMPRTWIPTVYELIPWSFFVDYFTDLGNVISALCFPRSDVAWASTSVSKTFSLKVHAYGARLDPAFAATFEELSVTDSPQLTTFSRKQVIRTRGAPQLPTPTVRLPKSLWVWANIAALTLSGFGRKDRDYVRTLRI